ncbi:MAG: ABC transporter permease [Lachnospiraceae bacterium]|nr:ABC transporter permease [Lachnospiraceae bacterium]
MKEPLFHIVKRTDIVWWRAWLIRILAIVLALILSAVVTVILTGLNPLKVFESLVRGAVGTERRILLLFQGTSILLCISLAVTPAFRMRFWNIGAEGQVLAGAMATATVMIFLGNKVPNAVLMVLLLLSALFAGALWAVIPAVFKAKWNTNETLFTLMMNYVAIQIVNYFVLEWSVPKGSGQIGIINASTQAGWLPKVFGQNYLINIIIVAVVTILIYVYLTYTKHGYEISVVGESEKTAKYIGINVKKVIIRTMVLSGAIAGLAGFLLVSGTDHTVTSETAGGQGFTAIMVSWLAKFNPIVMFFSAFLIVFLQRGSVEITTQFSLNKSFSDILTGIIIFFIIGCEFFINYRIIFRNSRKEVLHG